MLMNTFEEDLLEQQLQLAIQSWSGALTRKQVIGALETTKDKVKNGEIT